MSETGDNIILYEYNVRWQKKYIYYKFIIILYSPLYVKCNELANIFSIGMLSVFATGSISDRNPPDTRNTLTSRLWSSWISSLKIKWGISDVVYTKKLENISIPLNKEQLYNISHITSPVGTINKMSIRYSN